MTEQHLEDQLQEKLRQACDQARSIGYNPSFFAQMLANKGAVTTINQLLASQKYALGLTTLWELKALHLSVEAIILQEPYSQLFSPGQLQIARTRLTQLKYKFD